jgi:DNA-binding GntR family transcriptional regulator
MAHTTRYALESVFPTVDGWSKQSARDHRRVLAALKKGDGELARAAMAEHLCAGAKPLIDHLTRLGVVEDAQ